MKSGETKQLPEVNTSGIPYVCGSTTTIMRVLYESLIPSEKSKSKAQDLLLVLDSKAQTTYNNLPSVTDLGKITTEIDTGISAQSAEQKKNLLIQQANVQQQISQLQELLKEVTPHYDTICKTHEEIRQLLALVTDNKASPEEENKLRELINDLNINTRKFQEAAKKYNEAFKKVEVAQSSLYLAATGKTPAPKEGYAPPTLR